MQEEDDSDCDDSTVDRIDEQEIYGWFCGFIIPPHVGACAASAVGGKKKYRD